MIVVVTLSPSKWLNIMKIPVNNFLFVENFKCFSRTYHPFNMYLNCKTYLPLNLFTFIPDMSPLSHAGVLSALSCPTSPVLQTYLSSKISLTQLLKRAMTTARVSYIYKRVDLNLFIFLLISEVKMIFLIFKLNLELTRNFLL